MKKRLFVAIQCAAMLLTLIIPLSCSGQNGTPFASQSAPAATPEATFPPDAKLMTISVIDVGQGDSILIQTPNGKTMLIDAGDTFAQSAIVNTLNAKSIKKIDVLVATHPKQSHIGSMGYIVEHFAIGAVYMPEMATSNNVDTYGDLLKTIQNKKVPIVYTKAGMSVELDSALLIHIVAPNSNSYEDHNAFSIVMKITYGKNSFLFTGDASEISEKEMLAAKADIKADVLKIGHHGDAESTGTAFLNAVSPKIALVSVGRNNQYGYPTQEVLNRLNAVGASVYRTDVDGTIVITSDGQNFRISTLGL